MCVRGIYAVATLIPRHPWSHGPSVWLGKDDEPRKRNWEKAPRRGRRPSCCSVCLVSVILTRYVPSVGRRRLAPES